MTTKEFVSKLFEIEVTAHIAHLQTTSFAQHMALGELYDKIVDIRDSYIEAEQGCRGIITGYKINYQPEGSDMIKYLTTSSEEFSAFKKTVYEGDLQQLIDDLLFLLHQTIYKLRFLK